ncbi:hypothetical protein [Thermotoga sp.]|uniref:hypothetical protein n=1 Tax=Thermotoga sp. TaxID=28240 RepID=UPI0025D6CE49|nr:hypothetical protein [Thermotoga sp.]MCD6551472.1 hypothetical protein [Thermotoga sp.]
MKPVDYQKNLQKIIEIREEIKNVHPFLEKIFPVAIVTDGSFFVFEFNPEERRFFLVRKFPAKMEIPESLRAAFPLDFYANRIACVVTPDVFDSLEDYTAVFHEFIHCQQWEICELKLKQRLKVAQEAVRRGDYMWELAYPFPYEDEVFSKAYSRFLKALEYGDSASVHRCRGQLRDTLGEKDFEYMVWQEWKEGFARYIENRIRKRLGLTENHSGLKKPFCRTTFYEGGARLIEFFIAKEPELSVNIEDLFNRMMYF